MPVDVHDRAALERWRRERRLDPSVLKRVRNALCKFAAGAGEAAAELDAGDAAALRWHALALRERHDSELDGATKLLFETDAGARLETVILRYATGRTALCVSSQIGCAAACAFCATGTMGLTRSLECSEIVDQVVQANELLKAEGRRARNVVFMGMGEPFHNEAAVAAAIELLASPGHFDYAPQRLLVSTVGVPAAMLRFARRFPKVNLALSLHAAVQELRETLVPLARTAPLPELREAVRDACAIQRRPVMIEYVLLDDVNDGPAEIEALARWLDGLDVHVNLIPYNPSGDGDRFRPTPKPRREEIGAALRARGFKVTLRYSLGRDIAAACGQLVRAEHLRAAR